LSFHKYNVFIINQLCDFFYLFMKLFRIASIATMYAPGSRSDISIFSFFSENILQIIINKPIQTFINFGLFNLILM